MALINTYQTEAAALNDLVIGTDVSDVNPASMLGITKNFDIGTIRATITVSTTSMTRTVQPEQTVIITSTGEQYLHIGSAAITFEGEAPQGAGNELTGSNWLAIGGGSSITGLTTGTIPQAAANDTLVDSQITNTPGTGETPYTITLASTNIISYTSGTAQPTEIRIDSDSQTPRLLIRFNSIDGGAALSTILPELTTLNGQTFAAAADTVFSAVNGMTLSGSDFNGDTVTSTITYDSDTNELQFSGVVLPASFTGALTANGLVRIDVGGNIGQSIAWVADSNGNTLDNIGTVGAAGSTSISGNLSVSGEATVMGDIDSVTGSYSGRLQNQNINPATATPAPANFRIWAGTQAQFDEITEVTDGTVVYIIRANP